MSTLVIKFGGNVLSHDNGIIDALDAIDIQQHIWDNIIIVTSAFSGITDALHNVVQVAVQGSRNEMRQDIASIRELHIQSARLILGDSQEYQTLLTELDTLFFNLLDDCDLLHDKQQYDPAIADRIVAMGERFISRIMAATARKRQLQCVALDADKFIITDDRHSNARPIMALSQQRLEQDLVPLLEQNIIPIVTGYIGANQKGLVTTLGRGGSDYSATYLGALLMADEVWFFTDVDGLMSADPEYVQNARVLPTSSYREVSEMARYGAKVLHPHAIEPIIQAHIPLRIRSLEHPENTGTYIFSHQEAAEHRIHAVTQAIGLQIIGPSQSNLTEVCNRLISQHLNDDMQPSLQIDVYQGNLIVYVAPTSANKNAFYKVIEVLQNYEGNDDWHVTKVTIIAVIGNLILEDHIQILSILNQHDIQPSAFGFGQNGTFLLALTPEDATLAMNHIHTLI